MTLDKARDLLAKLGVPLDQQPTDRYELHHLIAARIDELDRAAVAGPP